MKKINKYFVSLLLIVSFLFCVNLVSALATDVPTSVNVTINTPIASAVLNGVVEYNVSLDAGYEDQNWSLVEVFLKSTLTSNSSNVLIATGNNNTNDAYINGTFSSDVVEDANNYIITLQLRNGTSAVSINVTRTGLTVENTIPQAASGLLPTSDTDGTVNFSATVVGENTTSCTLYFDGTNPGLSSYAMTYSNNGCSKQLTSVPEQSYRWYVRASDETNTTDSSKQTTNVDIKTSAGKAAQIIASGQGASQGGALLSITKGIDGVPGGYLTVIIAIAIIVAVVISRRK